MIYLHQDTYSGLYHVDPEAPDGVAWTVHDTRGYMDGGPSCDECGACECECSECGALGQAAHECAHASEDQECIGLSVAYVCLDGGDALCEACAEREGIEVKECNC